MISRPDQYRFPQLAKESLITSHKRGTPENRLWAKVIDFVILHVFYVVIGLFFHRLAWIAAFLMWCWVDSLGRGQSPGKWLLGLHTIEVQKASIPRFYHGLLRNLPFFFLSVSILEETLISRMGVGLSLLAIGFETYFVYTLRSGLRVGEVLANTRVFDFKDEHTQFIEQFLKKEGT